MFGAYLDTCLCQQALRSSNFSDLAHAPFRRSTLFRLCQLYSFSINSLQSQNFHSCLADIEWNWNFSSLLCDLNVKQLKTISRFFHFWIPAFILFLRGLWGSKVEPRCWQACASRHSQTIVSECFMCCFVKFDWKLVTTRVCMCRLSETAHTCAHQRKNSRVTVFDFSMREKLKERIIKKSERKSQGVMDGWMDGWIGANECQTCEKINAAMNKHEQLSPRWSVLFTTLEYKHICRCTQSLLISTGFFFLNCYGVWIYVLTVVSLFHFSNSGEANKVIRLDFVKEGKTVIFFCQNSAILPSGDTHAVLL